MSRHEEKLAPDFGYFVDGAECVASRRSPFQHIEILRSPSFGAMLRLDGALQCSERDEFFYHEALVHPALLCAARRERVLIVGGGDGGAAEEALKWPALGRLDHVEIDSDVIDLCRIHLPGIHRGVLDGGDPRYRLHLADAGPWLAGRRGEYDLIVLDLTDCGGPSEALYRGDFYAACAKALRPGGSMSLHLGAPYFHRAAIAERIRLLRGFFAHVEPYLVGVPMYGGQWTMALCHTGKNDPRTLSAEACEQALAGLSGPPLQAVDAAWLMNFRHLPPYFETALAGKLAESK